MKSKVLSLTILLSLAFIINDEVNCAKILSVEFFGTKSHVITYLPILEALAAKGHDVTLISPSRGLSKHKNIREIFTFDIDRMALYKDENNQSYFEPIVMKETNTEQNPFVLMTKLLPLFCKEVYRDPEVIKIMEESWDLVLVQPLFNECALGLVYEVTRKGAPLVLFTPTSAPHFVVSKLGGFHPMSFVSNFFLGYTDEMTFVQRFINTGFSIFMDFLMSVVYLPVAEGVYKEMLGDHIPSSHEILSNASILLSNGHFSLSRPKPNLPDVIEVGGIHSRPANPLPKDLEDFISKGGEDGFILFSLGTGIKGEDISEEKLRMFTNAFSKLKQQVIWKFGVESIPNQPSNLKLVKWMPQQDLLGHPKIKLFITHCGLGGTEESIYHGVPLIGMPFFGDQPLNAQEAENKGFLYRMDWNDLNEDYLLKGINQVLNNPKYRDNVQRLSKVFKDQIDDPLERGVWWVEYVMRHKGAPHLRSASRMLNYFQYHSLDVFAAFLTIGLITCVLLSSVVYLLFKSVFSFSKNLVSKEKISDSNDLSGNDANNNVVDLKSKKLN